MEPSLLQTVFLQNDKEMLDSISRRGSWLDELTKTLPNFQRPRCCRKADVGAKAQA